MTAPTQALAAQTKTLMFVVLGALTSIAALVFWLPAFGVATVTVRPPGLCCS